MRKTTINLEQFKPNWASPPGDTIADILREKNLTTNEFAEIMQLDGQGLKTLLNGRTAMTIGIARKLEQVLGASVEFWMSRELQYRDSIPLLDSDQWLSALPVSDMVKFGWIKRAESRSETLAACLNFFDVPSLNAWQKKYKSLFTVTAFRTSPTFASEPEPLAAWLRQGEVLAEKIDCSLWNRERFRATLTKIRTLTRRKNPNLFLPELQMLCAKCGVAVVVVRAPSGCRASGATRFLANNKALLQLSFRYLTDDQFWFSFFHEAGHLILHKKGAVFLEGMNDLASTEEMQANEFAEDTLIPDEYKADLLTLPLNTLEVIRFAVKVSLSPGIIVGQLQHFNVISQNQLNKLKRRFKWKH